MKYTIFRQTHVINHHMFDGLYHPVMVILGMVHEKYECFNMF